MNRLKKSLIHAVARLGGLRLFRYLANVLQVTTGADNKTVFPFIKCRQRPSAQILVYHRVNDEKDAIFPGVPTSVFKQQMEYLAENYDLCSLTELVQQMDADDLPANALAITFDDGYRDNYTNAFPILKQLGLPATIFLATDAIGTGRLLWHDRVFAAFRNTKLTSLCNWAGDNQSYPLHTDADKCATLDRCLKFLWSLDDEAKSAWMENLIAKLGAPRHQTDSQLMLQWDHIQEMGKYGIDFGSHTLTHPILSRVTLEQARREIEKSKDAIEAKLNIKVKHFAYPVGRRVDFNSEIKHLLSAVGYESAVTTLAGSNDPNRDRFELRRATPWDDDIDSFTLRLSYFKFAS